MSNQVVSKRKSLRKIFFPSDGQAYVVPRYQREYAWGREQIERLMTDIWEAFKTSPNGNYYLGTLVVMPKRKLSGEDYWEVIDGQQRLTTLSLLIGLTATVYKDAGKLRAVQFESRKVVNNFFAAFAGDGEWRVLLESGQNVPALVALGSAIDMIENFKPTQENGREYDKSVKTGLMNEKHADTSFMDFILNNVVLFEVQMPHGTDAMEYFEVMNNRGEQLEEHEIIKAELIARLYKRVCEENREETVARTHFEKLSYVFDLLWTACSKMNGHLVDHLHACINLRDNPTMQWTELDLRSENGDLDETDVPHERQSVIRDFSNFLMHTLRLYLRNCLHEVSRMPPLDEREIKRSFDEYLKTDKIDPIEFLQTLIRARLDFDRYVVKAKMEKDAVVQWCLKEVRRRDDGHYVARNTYGNDQDLDSCELQKSIVCLQSALQVSNAAQRYKEWVYEILSTGDQVRADGRRLLTLLEGFLAKRLNEEKAYWGGKGRNMFVLGLQTPRLLLNAIDYLMWRNGRVNKRDEFAVGGDFVFSYQNSIEHHHPQHDDQLPHDQRWSNPDDRDDIGNLFLVYSSENSSMSNREPQSKKHRCVEINGGELPSNPKRRWMYEHTYDDGRGWPKDEMQKLSVYVQTIVTEFLPK